MPQLSPLRCALALALAGPALAGAAHEPGVARLDIAVDAGRLSIAVDTLRADLLEAFKDLHRIEVQVATRKVRLKAPLLCPAARVALVR